MSRTKKSSKNAITAGVLITVYLVTYVFIGAISNLIQNKTVIVVAHRLNNVVAADKIVVLQEGRIVEQGTHEELLNQGGMYRELWDYQEKVKNWKITNTSPKLS